MPKTTIDSRILFCVFIFPTGANSIIRIRTGSDDPLLPNRICEQWSR